MSWGSLARSVGILPESPGGATGDSSPWHVGSRGFADPQTPLGRVEGDTPQRFCRPCGAWFGSWPEFPITSVVPRRTICPLVPIKR
jgi:hypothetical protein